MSNVNDIFTNARGILLDIFGVLFDSGPNGPVAIDGSINAVDRLKRSGIPVHFCTNTSTKTTARLAEELQGLGFDIQKEEIFSPPPVVYQQLKERSLRPFFVVDPGVLPEFADIDTTNPNCVVIGDSQSYFTYESMNKAFRILFDLREPVLISMGGGKYYKDTDGLKLDVGAYASVLEHALDIRKEVIGKPSIAFFQTAVNSLGVDPAKVIMIGDDIVSDVGGAQDYGIPGILVRTGKYRGSSDEPHASIKPAAYVDNLAQFADIFLGARDSS